MKYNTTNFIGTIIVIGTLFSCTPDEIYTPIDQRIGSLPMTVIDPIDNPTTPEKVALGKLLFWDPVLSGGKDVACATCHHPDNGYAENIDLSIGVGGNGLSVDRSGGVLIKRNAPTIINTAFNGINAHGIYEPSNTVMFWDNRSNSLETQAIEPILSMGEMRGNIIQPNEIYAVISQRLADIPEYVTLFDQVFGANTVINEDKIGKAIAAFERSLIANNSPFDQYARGDEGAMSAQQIRGMNAFLDANCTACHGGPMFSDYELHDIGIPENPKLNQIDQGVNNGEFRTPTLRNLSETGPYMHNGTQITLEDSVNFYEDFEVNDDDAASLDFDDNADNVAAIVAFLQALNDPNFDREIPETVPSGLPVGGNIQ